MSDILKRLQQWYSNQCDGDWEQEYGIKIHTLDNPGWSVSIDLAETRLENLAFQPVKIERNENDWVHCWIKDEQFQAACGPDGLIEVFEIFIDFSEKKKHK